MNSTPRLKHVATMRAGGTPRVDDVEQWAEDGVPWVAIGDMTRSPIVTKTERCVSPLGIKTKNLPVGRPGTILFAMYASVGSLGVLATRATWNQAILGIEPIPDLAESRFLSYWLEHLRPSLSEMFRSNTQDNLNADQVANLNFSPLSCKNQGTIANFLDTETARIDGLIVKKRQMRRLLDTRLAAYRAHLMLNGIDPTSTDASHPGVAKLGVAVTLQRGHDLPADTRKDGIVPVISSGGFSGTHDIAAVEGPGVVTGRYGTIGKSFYVETDYWPLNTTLYIRDFRGCWPKWVYHLLASLPLDIDSAKSAVTGIDRNVVGDLRIRIRSVADQREISIQLDQEEARTCRISERIDGQIALLQERRQALITAAVTGEMEVPGVRR